MTTMNVGYCLFLLPLLWEHAHAGRARTPGFLGSVAQGVVKTVLPGAMGVMSPYMGAPPVQPTAEQRQRIEAAETSQKSQQDLSELSNTVMDVSSKLKQINGDIGEPLKHEVAGLTAEKDRLLKQITVLTKTLRFYFNKQHPDKVNTPLVIVAKTKDDDMRVKANEIDQQGALDVLEQVASPCAAFHNVRKSEEDSLKSTDSDDTDFDAMQKTLGMMTPNERIPYDEDRVKQLKSDVKEIDAQIKETEKEAAQRNRAGMMMPAVTAPMNAGYYPAPPPARPYL